MVEVRYKIENKKTYILAFFKSGDFYTIINRPLTKEQIIKYFNNKKIYYKFNIINQWGD